MELGPIGNVAATKVQRNVDSVQNNAAPVSAPPKQTMVQTVNAVQQTAAAPSMEQVKQAVDEINKSMQALSRGLVFSVDEESHRTIVKIVDQQTDEIVRQIPSEEALAIAKSLDQVVGKLIQQKA